MKIILPNKQEIAVVNNHDGTYFHGEETFCEQEIFPAKAEDFVAQQLLIIKQIWHFAQSFGIPMDVEVIPTRKFVVSEMKAIESNTDWCFIFENYLAVCRKNEQIPYVFLHRSTSTRSPTSEIPQITIDDDTWWTSINEYVHQNIVCVIHNGSELVYDNKRNNYSLDMGVMYLLLKNPMFQEAFIVNSMSIEKFIDIKPRYLYEPLNKILHYELKSEGAQKIISFLMNYEEFILRRKLTFTWQKHEIFKSKNFIPLSEFERDERNPKDPVQFLHFQFVHAVHMFEYVRNTLKIYRLINWIDNYRTACFQILERFMKSQEQSQHGKTWNPGDVLELLKKHDCNHLNQLPLSKTIRH